MKEFYEELYNEEVNIKNLKEQKRISPAKHFKRDIIEKALKDLPYNSKVIEIGAGLGDIIGFLKFQSRKGTDVSENVVIKSKQMFPEVLFNIADANQPLDEITEFYDAVLLPDIIEHLENDETILNESYRILKHGGKLVLITGYNGQEQDTPRNDAKYAFGLGGDLRDYGWNLIDRVEKKGFKITKVIYLDGHPAFWDLKEKVLKDQKNNIMTGNYMPKNSWFKKFVCFCMFWAYKINHKVYGNKRNVSGDIVIVGEKI